MGKLVLVTGGVRSGKSSYGVKLAKQLSNDVVFLATAHPGDEEMKKRIKNHQKNRPSHWVTVEEQRDVTSRLREINAPRQVVIIDCITVLISNQLSSIRNREILNQIEKIAQCGRRFNLATIIISNEVGWGVVPVHPLGRRFRDISGEANQLLAQYADEIYLMISGIPLRIKPQES